MAARTNNAGTTLPFADLAVQMRDQWLTSVKQSQDLALGAAKAVVGLAKSVPLPEIPNLIPKPDVSALPRVDKAVTFAFELVTETLAAQRNFLLQITELVQPAVAA